MNAKKIVAHPSSKMGAGRDALRRGDMKALIANVAEVSSVELVKTAMIDAAALDVSTDPEQLASRTADALINAYGDCSLHQATILAQLQAHSEFSVAVLDHVKNKLKLDDLYPEAPPRLSPIKSSTDRT